MYRLSPAGVTRLADGVQIQRGDPAWPDYLAWLAAGGVPEVMPTTITPASPDPVPLSVTRFQARAALQLAGLLDDAEAAVAKSHPLSRIAWEHAHVYRRDSPTVISIGKQLGLSEADMDELFKTAASITA
jgi:hypothetical protein